MSIDKALSNYTRPLIIQKPVTLACGHAVVDTVTVPRNTASPSKHLVNAYSIAKQTRGECIQHSQIRGECIQHRQTNTRGMHTAPPNKHVVTAYGIAIQTLWVLDTVCGRAEECSIAIQTLWVLDTVCGRVAECSIAIQTLWVLDTVCGRAGECSIAIQTLWVLDTVCGRAAECSITIQTRGVLETREPRHVILGKRPGPVMMDNGPGHGVLYTRTRTSNDA